MPLEGDKLRDYVSYVEGNAALFKDRLAEAVAIPSVSSDLGAHLADIATMMEWTKSHIERLNGRAWLRENPRSTSEEPLPPVLLGEFRASIDSGTKKTVCAYGHLDVQPARMEDGWDTDPFALTEKDGRLYGRGSTDDKGPALSWIWVVEAHQKLGMDLPVNVKLLFEGMEESGSVGTFDIIMEEAQESKFLSDVDYFCISDNYWLGKTKPCLTYGLRGLAYFQVSVHGCEQDLHSGVMGGSVHEAMTDVTKLMSSLVDSDGTILVDGIMKDVREVTPEEDALYGPIDFCLDDYKESVKIVGKRKLLKQTKKEVLMARWRYPTLSLHGIEGAFSGIGAKTVIPAKVLGKFSLRLVPDQDPQQIEAAVKSHLSKEFIKLDSPNVMEVTMIHGAKAWMSDPGHPNYAAASRAVERVYGSPPDLTREGGSIPVTNAMEDATGMNVLLLPIGACDDMAHSQNEKFNVVNMINGIKVLGLYLHELGDIEGPKPSSCRCEPLSKDELMIPGAFVRGFRCKCEM